MRSIPLLLLAGAVAGCTTAPTPYARGPEAQAQLQRLIGARVAGPEVTCIPEYRTDDMVAIDPQTIAIESGRTVYINNVRGPCYRLGLPGYAMRMNRFGGGLCSGEIIEVIDTATGMGVGSCSLGPFIPYHRS